ncbi:(2Fe-2S) ferredoxin domain-containing protein [Phytoactinopolyspora endophytica]|uniref:(2Fe-2S) ferredoxin domain-containing protein n=1 Tax=Phytoactinopolyspora endophytica TaxID=1642495 RepID=UPI00101D04A8|nr:(2Fe-2S) ferredoxin domain-containing protein [Phytoactinopolyspora endophytica]
MLDHGERSLHDVLDTCRHDAAAEVLVVPVQVPRDRYLETWIDKAIAHWREKAEGSASNVPEVRIGVGASETGEMVQALRAAVNGPSRTVTASPESFRSPSWSTIGGHRHHVLVCRGPRCSSHGSPSVAAALGERLQDGPVGYDDVLVTNTGCLVPCNLGPIVVVQPDDVWYTAVDADAIGRIVDEHLAGGRVVDELCTPRSTTQEEA